VSHPLALGTLPALGIARVVLPRELSVDEMRDMAEAAPEGLALEAFVHGALCYNVSGRCYWSSFLGGKSGLRGRCVQPCRRLYEHRGVKGRYFSCQDLSLDVLTKALLTIPEIRAWKIEGRKKGPHSVYYMVAAYKLLRDAPDDASAKKMALSYLEQSLGRTGTNYNFLSQRPKNPVDTKERSGSGMPAGKLTRGLKSGQYNLSARVALLPGDLLRVGCEDEAGHRIVKVTRNVPKGGRFTIGFEADARPESGTLVFLIDRREPGLLQKLRPLEEELAKIPERKPMPETFAATLPKPRKAGRQEPLYISVWRHPDMHKEKGAFGVWVSTKRAHNLPLGRAGSVWWWLPPVVWPDEESEFVSLLEAMVSRGGKRFVLGAPWQTGLFPAKARKGLEFWAGPFCNVANPLALAELGRIGFAGAIVSPELSGADLLALPALSPLPLGVVARGAWPLGLSRALSGEVKTCQTVLSPKEEGLWAVKYDRTYWLYPNWEVDLSKHGQELAKAGYTLFIDLREPMPREVERRERTSQFNWDVGLL